MIQPVFYIPDDIEFVVVSDMFAKDYTGGAELTLDAILQKAPGAVFELHSASCTAELVEANKGKYWILGNFTQMPRAAIIELVVSKVNFAIIECDYKFCKHRSTHLHKLNEGKDCDCHTQENGIFIRGLYQRAQKVYFMSEAQMQVYIDKFPQAKPTNFIVQTSTFKSETLDMLAGLRETRSPTETWAVLGGYSWIKAEEETKKWCEEKGMKYEVVGGLPPAAFLRKLSGFKGLVFRPAGHDTCPRVVIESKLMGLECILSENVQHKDEGWFVGSVDETEQHLRGRTAFFWKTLDK